MPLRHTSHYSFSHIYFICSVCNFSQICSQTGAGGGKPFTEDIHSDSQAWHVYLSFFIFFLFLSPIKSVAVLTLLFTELIVCHYFSFVPSFKLNNIWAATKTLSREFHRFTQYTETRLLKWAHGLPKCLRHWNFCRFSGNNLFLALNMTSKSCALGAEWTGFAHSPH